MLNAATLLAALALCANNVVALPAVNEALNKRVTVEYEGQLVDCDQTAFLQIYPPTEIELKCREAQGIPSNFVRRDLEINARDTIEHNGRQINCDETAFPAVMPPSELQLKCRAAREGTDSNDLIGGHKRDVAAPIRYVHVGKRQVVDVGGVKINCATTSFLAVFPPSEAEMACRNAGKQAKEADPFEGAPRIG